MFLYCICDYHGVRLTHHSVCVCPVLRLLDFTRDAFYVGVLSLPETLFDVGHVCVLCRMLLLHVTFTIGCVLGVEMLCVCLLSGFPPRTLFVLGVCLEFTRDSVCAVVRV